MKYEIEFDNNTVEQFFMDIYHAFEQSEHTFEVGDLMRNIVNVTKLESTMNTLRLFGADTECGTYLDNDFFRVGYARINKHMFVKNGVPNYARLKDALWELAHPAERQTVKQLPVDQNPDFVFEQGEDHAVILKQYKGTDANVLIPDGVTEIGRCAFSEGAFNHSPILQSVTIPDCVTVIRQGAFDWCTALQHVFIPDSVKTIEEAAFRHCESLQSVIIPDSVTTVGDLVFYGCSSLKTVTLPNDLVRIGFRAIPEHTKIIRAEPKKAVESSSNGQTTPQAPKHRTKHL